MGLCAAMVLILGSVIIEKVVVQKWHPNWKGWKKKTEKLIWRDGSQKLFTPKRPVYGQRYSMNPQWGQNMPLMTQKENNGQTQVQILNESQGSVCCVAMCILPRPNQFFMPSTQPPSFSSRKKKRKN